MDVVGLLSIYRPSFAEASFRTTCRIFTTKRCSDIDGKSNFKELDNVGGCYSNQCLIGEDSDMEHLPA